MPSGAARSRSGLPVTPSSPYPEIVRAADPTTDRGAALLHQAARALRGAGYVVVDATTPVAAQEHAAIASTYAHVTAPLRRLADRFANKVALALCAGRPVPAWATDALPSLPKLMGAAHERDGALARAMVDAVEALVLRDRVGEQFGAAVTNVDDRGGVVQLPRSRRAGSCRRRDRGRPRQRGHRPPRPCRRGHEEGHLLARSLRRMTQAEEDWDAGVERILVVTAHPDDVDFGSAGSVATWTDKGIEVAYCIVTDGDAGGFDPEVPRREIAGIRQREQTEAAKEVGVAELHFLGHPDGALYPTLEVRRDISRVIRQVRPQRVVCPSPDRQLERIYASHPDHLAAGEAAICAVYPDARNPFATRSSPPRASRRGR